MKDIDLEIEDVSERKIKDKIGEIIAELPRHKVKTKADKIYELMVKYGGQLN